MPAPRVRRVPRGRHGLACLLLLCSLCLAPLPAYGLISGDADEEARVRELARWLEEWQQSHSSDGDGGTGLGRAGAEREAQAGVREADSAAAAPPASHHRWHLWLGPLVAALVWLLRLLVQRQRRSGEQPLGLPVRPSGLSSVRVRGSPTKHANPPDEQNSPMMQHVVRHRNLLSQASFSANFKEALVGQAAADRSSGGPRGEPAPHQQRLATFL